MGRMARRWAPVGRLGSLVNPCASGWLQQGREGGKLSVRASGFAAADNPEASGPGLRDGADR